MTRVSVIIPTFNRKELLQKTLANLLEQSLAPFEIIVVDDGSTDGTFEFINSEYRDKVQIILNEGKGPGAARNTGLRIAKGDYIKFFDSDDLMTSNMLEVETRILEESGRDCIYCPYFKAIEVSEGQWDIMDEVILQFEIAPQKRPLHYWMLRGLFIMIQGFLFRKDLLKKVGHWRTDITTYEDWDYLWRVAQFEPYPLHTNACAFLYRIHSVQITGNSFDDVARDKDKITCFLGVLDYVKEKSPFGVTDRLTLESHLAYLFKKQLKMNGGLNDSFPWQNWKYVLMNSYIRIKNKIGRLKTETSWQPMHGPLKSRTQANRFLQLINTDYRICDLTLGQSKQM